MGIPEENKLLKAIEGFSSIPSTRDFSRHFAEMPKVSNPLIELAGANMASEFHERLSRYIEQFEEALDENYEVGVRLVSFGRSITFHVNYVGYFNPSSISFDGQLDDGSPVQLVQHVSQISFLLMAVKRLDPAKPKRRIGFGSQPEPTSEG